MALSKNVNAYVTVSEANSYFEDRLDAAAWTDASDLQKSQSLVTAAAILNDLNWVGTAVSESQTLAFPRNGIYFDPRQGLEVYLDGNVPVRILVANYELAYHLLNNDGLLDSTGSVDSLQLGTISLTKIRSTAQIPNAVQRHIKPLLMNNGASAWWRAN